MSPHSLQALDQTLKTLFVGDLQHLQGILVLGHGADPAALPVAEILSDAHLSAMVEVFSQIHGRTPDIAVHSIWSKWFFATVLPPLICSAVLTDRLPPSRFNDFHLLLNGDYKIERVYIPHGVPIEVHPGSETRFRQLIQESVAAFIELFHRRTGVSARVLWSNAGNLFEGVIRHLEKINIGSAGVSDGDALLGMTAFNDGTRNRLYKPVTYPFLAGERARRRRVCCLRYMLPDRKLCCACPRHELAGAATAKPTADSQGDRR